ncbi:hypothetical protein KAI87_13245 [Myxococcota bacterium]|nr:hypothetical protein [Myxococcota bacterium]
MKILRSSNLLKIMASAFIKLWQDKRIAVALVAVLVIAGMASVEFSKDDKNEGSFKTKPALREMQPTTIDANLTKPELSASDRAKPIYTAGVKALGRGEFDLAVNHLKRCIVVDPGFGLCYRALGIAYARAGDGPTAEFYYQEYRRLMPKGMPGFSD